MDMGEQGRDRYIYIKWNSGWLQLMAQIEWEMCINFAHLYLCNG